MVDSIRKAVQMRGTVKFCTNIWRRASLRIAAEQSGGRHIRRRKRHLRLVQERIQLSARSQDQSDVWRTRSQRMRKVLGMELDADEVRVV